MNITEQAVFELIGRQTVEIDQLRRGAAQLAEQNKALEARAASVDRCASGECDCDGAVVPMPEGKSAEAKA